MITRRRAFQSLGLLTAWLAAGRASAQQGGFVDSTLTLMASFLDNGARLFDGVSTSAARIDAKRLSPADRLALSGELDQLLNALDALLNGKRLFVGHMTGYIAMARAPGAPTADLESEWKLVLEDVRLLGGLVTEVFRTIERAPVLGASVDRQTLSDLNRNLNGRTILLLQFDGMERPRTSAELNLLETIAQRSDTLREQTSGLRDALREARRKIKP
jgi:hypothetical protein